MLGGSECFVYVPLKKSMQPPAGPANETHRSPNSDESLASHSVGWLQNAVWNEMQCQMSAWQNLGRYWGLRSTFIRCIREHSLKTMRCSRGNRCRSINDGVTWSRRPIAQILCTSLVWYSLCGSILNVVVLEKPLWHNGGSKFARNM